MNKKPLSFSERFLGWFCKEQYLEEIIGDLLEYQDELVEKPSWKRKLLYWFHVFNFLKPWALKRFSGTQKLNNYGMFKNYFKIAQRSLLKQKFYAFINIGGLSIGLTCFLMIFLYVQHEKSYDQFYGNTEQIHRVYQQNKGHSYRGSDAVAITPAGLAQALIEEIPEVINATAISDQTALLGDRKNQYYENGLIGDSNFFRVFEHKLITGNIANALSKAESIILSESLSKKIFGEMNPLGKEIKFNVTGSKIVTGIMEDIPQKSSLKFSFVTSMLANEQYVQDLKEDRWNNNDYHTFFTIGENVDQSYFETKLMAMVDGHLHQIGKELGTAQFLIQPITDLHLETYFNFDIGEKGNPQYVKLFSFIALLVLFLACVNYMNLAIARSVKRAKEVGLRKVIGAKKHQLILQFLVESILLTTLALVFAIGLTYLLTPLFGRWVNSPVDFNLHKDFTLLPVLSALVLVIGALSGSYPAFVMSALSPIEVLKGSRRKRLSGPKIQHWLITGQYATSIILIVGSMVIYNQFNFMQNKELGYQKEQILTVSVFDRDLRNNIEKLKTEWEKNPNIISVSATNELPTDVTSGTMMRNIGMALEDRFLVYRARIDYDYLDLFGIELLAGRNYSKDIENDFENNRVINESAAKALGWTTEEAIGQTYIESKNKNKTVIGVVKDFHMHSMRMEIGPLILVPTGTYFDYIALKLDANNLPETIAAIGQSIGQYSSYPFEYQFLDDRFAELYKSELKLGEMFGVFTVLAIIIASLGLFGLAAFTASQRIKEIGIRKVLGASVKNIVAILTSDLLKLVLLGFILAVPIAWFAMNRWLEDFAYRIHMEWWMFALAGGTALVIALLTISSQSIKAALTNPVNCLQNE